MQELLIGSPLLFLTAVFLFSLLIGSFLNVVIYRLPIMMEREWRAQCRELSESPATQVDQERFNIVEPRSRCPACGHRIPALENIPVVSYLFLRGRCAGCGTSISLRYPIVEVLTAVMAALAAWRFGFGWESAAAVLLTFCLIAVSAIDIDHQIIPDSISLPLLWIGLGLSLFHPLPGAEVLFIEPKASIVGALAGYLSLWSVYHLVRQLTEGAPPLLVGTRASVRGSLSQFETTLLNALSDQPQRPVHLAPDRPPRAAPEPQALFTGSRLILEFPDQPNEPVVTVHVTDTSYDDVAVSVEFSGQGPPVLLLDSYEIGGHDCEWPDEPVSPLLVVRRGREVTTSDDRGRTVTCANAPSGRVTVAARVGETSTTLTSLVLQRR
jgi:leader peptidase (prepilin peptidase)/N-methyltransferase